jgi:hypothetical protein
MTIQLCGLVGLMRLEATVSGASAPNVIDLVGARR